eukprot:TRINITY_DN4491_c0_g1_i1.p1 TRINITY_DN4491_c0_g1~~TRINITY_DN4491_c0_g1_i1.p1  ORF type:complete len:312 (+),score=100.67 TRINITY_DN4491_c0_g1_i1:53-988(+)
MAEAGTSSHAEGTPQHKPGTKHGRYVDKPMQSGYLLQQMERRLRPSDVIVNTLPKCGQTWLTALLMSIKLRGDFSSVNHMFEHVPWLEVTWPDEEYNMIPLDTRVAQMEAVGEPRVFKMHVDWEDLPLGGRNDIKVITVTRDVRDLPYSFFNHMHSHDPRFMPAMGLPPPPDDFDVYFDAFFLGRPPTTWMRQMWAHKDDENVLVLRFEDMKEDLEREAKKVIAFLGWDPVPDEVLREHVLPAVHIDRLRPMLHTKMYPGVFVDTPGRGFIREGAVGRNRQHLSESQCKRLRAVMEKDLPQEAVDFWYREV